MDTHSNEVDLGRHESRHHQASEDRADFRPTRTDLDEKVVRYTFLHGAELTVFVQGCAGYTGVKVKFRTHTVARKCCSCQVSLVQEQRISHNTCLDYDTELKLNAEFDKKKTYGLQEPWLAFFVCVGRGLLLGAPVRWRYCTFLHSVR